MPVGIGKLVVYLPWEFEIIPDAWVGYLNRSAHEVWVPAEFVRSGFVRSGLDESLIHVVGHGAPDDVCRMTDPRQLKEPSRRDRRSFRFLYHGGMLWRKGVDLLLKAYAAEFSVEDDVLLVVHSVYGDEDVYQHVRDVLASMGAESPRVHFLQQKLNATELAGIYASADAFVHPSRSEGFGLGIVEAMAYGVPPVLPAYGPPMEFVSNSTGFLFPCAPVPCGKPPCRPDSRSVFSEDWKTSSPLMWGEYEPAALGAAMRFAYDNPEEVEKRGAEARRHACGEMSWDRVYGIMRQRLAGLASGKLSPVVREEKHNNTTTTTAINVR
jgi:glycosyltransferase involved in cell wall biosynthesis